ncbi:FAD-binding oxidoreductase [Paracoccus sp. DMF-8]|uniref:NAD(P)/FAD-dependent oxidoreductase n=1 Tax=Paracoccus sp. DMF-8 TaxID=3019445 RepID=UPI0023E40063|nr:FAD-binding oxidoreductase [Paracoccus sp. DMF-8]MDF3608016.1 FAD-binding oxidoreductase [Paracoccus sp. DMF-8]
MTTASDTGHDAPRNGRVSFWYADIGGLPDRRPPLPGDRQADVCIIGAGYTGLWAARYLKALQPDLDIAVVEREFAGFGASGRNGGWLTSEFSWNRERYAAATSRQQVIALETALRDSVAEVIGLADAQGIDADIRRNDCMIHACAPAQWQRLRDDHARELGWQVPADSLSLIGAAEARARIDVAGSIGALVRHGTARIQPAKLVRGLARVVERAGVRIFEATTVTRIDPGRVVTDRGTLTAPIILRATEGFTPTLAGHRRDLVPVNSAIAVTQPLPRALWDRIGWQGCELLSDASHLYSYAQRTRDGRIAMGGRGVPYRYGSGIDDRGRTQDATIRQLQDMLHRLLPQVRGLRLDHVWCGVLGVPRDWCANVAYDPGSGMGWAGGYVGTGVAASNLAGRVLADLVLGRDTDLTRLAWVNRTARRWQPEPLRWLGIHAMYRLYHLADRQERRGDGRRGSWLADLADRLTGR